MHNAYADRGLVVLGVAWSPEAVLRSFVDKFGPKYPVVRSNSGWQRYSVPAAPMKVLVSASGRLLAGPTRKDISKEQLEAALRSVTHFPSVVDSSKLSELSRACAEADVLGVARALPLLENREDLTEGHVGPCQALVDARRPSNVAPISTKLC